MLAGRSNIVKKLDFYHRLTDPDYGEQGDSDSDDGGAGAVDNRYGRRRNNRPIKPVHNRDVEDAGAKHFAYEPVSKKDNMFTPERRPGGNHMSVDRRDAYERVSASNFLSQDEGRELERHETRYGFSDSRHRPVSQGDMLIAAKQKRQMSANKMEAKQRIDEYHKYMQNIMNTKFNRQ